MSLQIRLAFSLSILFFLTQWALAQDDRALIDATLMDYIEGTQNGEPDRLKRAFHEDANLYFVDECHLKTWSGKGYISNFEPGKKANRIGKIVSVDITNDAASAIVEVDMPARKRRYTDYMLLLKIEDHWKIIHKSFSYVNY